MHLYENAERSVYAWNAVDVETNGQLYHGHVIGMEENGSAPSRPIVDFGCPSHQAVTVPYVTTWDCSVDRSNSVRVGDTVQVLLCDGAAGTWKWHSGKMLIDSFKHLKDMALVEVTEGELSRRELVPRRQIRITFKSRRLTVGDFVMRTCSVPNGYWALQPSLASLLLRQVEKNLQLRFVTVLSQTMKYVSRSPSSSSRDENAQIGIVFERERVVCERGDYRGHGLVSNVHNCDLKRKKLLGVGERGLALPVDVLKEIFRSLDTIGRQRCRRTCSLWEAVFTSPELCQDLCESRQQPSPSSRVKWEFNYAIYACIFKHLTPATRTICIRDPKAANLWDCSIQPDTEEALDLMKKHLNQPSLRIHSFILHQRSIRLSERNLSILATQIVAQLSKSLSYCDHMIWKDCELKLVDNHNWTLMQFCIPVAVFTRGQLDAAHIVDLLESHIRWDGQPLDQQRIVQFMADPIENKKWAKKVQKILHDYQSCDPRPSHYRDHQWTLNNLASVDVGKLNRCVCTPYGATSTTGQNPRMTAPLMSHPAATPAIPSSTTVDLRMWRSEERKL